MDQPLVLAGESHQLIDSVYGMSQSSWTLYPAVDPYGDGWVAHMQAELDDDGSHAETTATTAWDGGTGDLAAFMRQLADDWQGWHGTRAWRDLE